MSDNQVTPTTEGVAEAIEELEDKGVEGEQETEEEEVETEPTAEEDDESTEKGEDTIDSLLQELVANKYEISDELKEKAEKAGINIDSVELAGIKDKANAEATIQSTYDDVGGKENFEAMRDWVKNGGITEEEAEEFNKALFTENRSLMVKGMFAMFKASAPEVKKEEPKPKEEKKDARTVGKPQQNKSFNQGYKSLKEMQEAISYMRKNPSDSDAQRTYDKKMKYSGGLLKR